MNGEPELMLLLLCRDRREVYRQLRGIYPSLACRQFLEALQQLERECGYGEDRIPQLRDVSAFLKGDILARDNRKRQAEFRQFCLSLDLSPDRKTKVMESDVRDSKKNKTRGKTRHGKLNQEI